MGLWPFRRKPTRDAEETSPEEASPEALTSPSSSRRSGWWLTAEPVERGAVQTYEGDPIVGRQGLHAAPGPLAALPYAKGERLCQVELDGTVAEVDGQLSATWRRVVFAVDATEVLGPLVKASIERLIGEPVGAPSAHREAAGAARERVVEASDRVRDARWVLEEGAGTRGGAARAEAEGKLAGAERAAAEARAQASAHEAAAALGEGTGIRTLSRAVEHLVAARAAFENGGVDEAHAAARARLDEELVAALLGHAPAEPLPEVRVAPKPPVAATDEAAPAPLEPGAASPGVPPEAQRLPPLPLPLGEPRRVSVGPTPRPAPPRLSAWPLEVPRALHRTLARYAVRRVHELLTPNLSKFAGVVVRVLDESGADELLDALDRDPSLAAHRIPVAVIWDQDGDIETWSVRVGRHSRRGPFERSRRCVGTDHAVLHALRTPPIPRSAMAKGTLDALLIEILEGRPGVHFCAFLPLRGGASALGVVVDASALPNVLALAERYGVSDVVARDVVTGAYLATERLRREIDPDELVAAFRWAYGASFRGAPCVLRIVTGPAVRLDAVESGSEPLMDLAEILRAHPGITAHWLTSDASDSLSAGVVLALHPNTQPSVVADPLVRTMAGWRVPVVFLARDVAPRRLLTAPFDVVAGPAIAETTPDDVLSAALVALWRAPIAVYDSPLRGDALRFAAATVARRVEEGEDRPVRGADTRHPVLVARVADEDARASSRSTSSACSRAQLARW
ncbi:MAG: hypothetical protein R3B82_09355 [Sandaracinaceae bacterium]